MATAVPAFIGYTPQAVFQGQSYTNVPVRITSFADFEAFFCLPDPNPTAAPVKQYNPQYYLVPQKSQPAKGDYQLISGTYYSFVPDPNTIYYLYNSVKLFYENGGGTAYVVSVGSYGPTSQNPMTPGVPPLNPNVQLSDLTAGLATLLNETEPTLYLCPDATLLSLNDNATLMQAMLQQTANMQTAMCIFDIIGGNDPDPSNYMQDILNFRANTGNIGLDYGMAYYPFIGTNLMQNQDIDYTNLFGGDITQLEAIINPAASPDPAVTAIITTIKNGGSGSNITQNNNALLTACRTYADIMNAVLAIANTLPPSGGMTGVITATDNNYGPWEAPANTTIVDAVSVPIRLSDVQQDKLSIDPVSGKSVNAIRMFTGLGILIWGARTLDGNSQDWRFIPVRRTMIYLKQSCKAIVQGYASQTNDPGVWFKVQQDITAFLTSVWNQGGLQGATANNAFSVNIGLGTANTPTLQNDIMCVTVNVAVIAPAEFLVIAFEQQMASAT